MDLKPVRDAAWSISEESRPAASPFSRTVRQPQAMTSLGTADQQSDYQNENRELVRMLAGLLGLVSLVFMVLYAMIRF